MLCYNTDNVCMMIILIEFYQCTLMKKEFTSYSCYCIDITTII